ncbi:YfbU family protein [Variovorax paradoxus]|uniref:YfbU family protein n=1 Tax=Variovorax paradoxus TaxID=34073 RepID=UPI00040D8B24
MKLTTPEKLILSMLAQLHLKLGIEPENAKLISSAIHTDNTWALTWELQGIPQDKPEADPREVKEVVNYLDMWSFIEAAMEKLAAAEKKEVNDACHGRTTFPGFDGNNEPQHYSIANFLIKDMNRWAEFSKRDLNSHHETLDRAARMFEVFEPMRAKLERGTLSKDQLIAILTA